MSNERTSVFLESRVTQFRQVVEFFSAKSGNAGTRRLLVFLTQIEFWNWEFDCLRHASEGFAGRAVGWRTPPSGVEEGLIELGFRVKRHVLGEVKDELRTQQSSIASVSVPRKQYDALVTEWNALLTRAQDLFDEGRITHDVSTGASIKTDLSGYRKRPLQDRTEQSAPPNSRPLSPLPGPSDVQSFDSQQAPSSGGCR